MKQRKVGTIFSVLFLFLKGCQSRPTEIEINEDYDEDPEIYQPKNLVADSVTQFSISLSWELEVDPVEIDKYRIHYKHQHYVDVITILQSENSYVLEGLVPYTSYEIWVESIVNGTTSERSESIFAQTDVQEPSPPKILNLTCWDTGAIYLEWARPEE